MFWNDNVGASEKGHQVVYLGHKTVGGRDMLCFWGSQRQNKKKRPGGTEALYFPATEGGKVDDGYGEACRPRSDVKAMIFSRVTCMEHLAAGLDDMRAKAMASRGAPFPFVDEFLVLAEQDLLRPGDARSRVRHSRRARYARQSRARSAAVIAVGAMQGFAPQLV